MKLILSSLFTLSLLSIPTSAIDWKWIGDTTAVVTNFTEAFNTDGSPKNLVNIANRLDADLLDDFYGMVPEGVQVPNALLTTSFTNISVKSDLDPNAAVTAKVTFLNEGAGYKNSLGYFIYQTDSPPTSISEVEHIIIMANTSKTYSGGSLDTGDQIDLMIQLTAGQSIGFFINSNGWAGFRGQQKSNLLYDQPFYTLESLNPTVGLGQRYHVVFNDSRSTTEGGSGFFAYGFEDIKTTGGDKDYNDLIFNVEVTPVAAIEDYEDAVDIESVSSQVNTKTGVLAFEDNWPQSDDYDFNDAVLDYDITTTLDGDNNNDTVKSIILQYQINAIGATFHNGIAVRIPGLTESMIEGVTLDKTIGGTTNSFDISTQVSTQMGSGENVTYTYPLIKDSEYGDSSVSFTLSEDLFEELSTFDGTTKVFETYNCMYRTATGGSQCPANTSAATIKLTINVNSTQLNANDLGAMPFDHYMFGTHKNDLYRYARKNSDSDWFAAWKQHYSSRDAANGPGPGKYLEIHLKEFSTGTNVFESDFSVSDYSGAVSVDAQNHAQGNPFITKQITRRGILTGNLPWVLDLPDNWKHPRENVDISIAYPNFFRWAEDNATFSDWYSSYVNQNKIYND